MWMEIKASLCTCNSGLISESSSMTSSSFSLLILLKAAVQERPSDV